MKLHDTPDIDLLKASIANFATKGFSQFSLSLKITRRTESRPEQFPQEFLRDPIPVDFKILHVQGRGNLSSCFLHSDMLRREVALQSKFKLNYTIEFVKNRGATIFSSTYPAFFPNWMSTIALFKAINLCIIRYETKTIALDINCTPLNLLISS